MNNVKTMILQLEIKNTSKNIIQYENGTDTPIDILPGEDETISITVSGRADFTLTDLINNDAPLAVTLYQTGEDGVDISVLGSGWNIIPTAELLICDIISSTTTIDQIKIPTSATGDAIVIVGTVEIGDLVVK